MKSEHRVEAPGIESHKIRMAIEKLPHKNQEVIFMRFWDLLTIEEMAQKLKLTWAQAHQLIERSMEMLKKNLLEGLHNKTSGGKYEKFNNIH